MADIKENAKSAGKSPAFKFLTFLVGFQDVADHAATSPLLGKIRSLVPEAHIVHHSIYSQGPNSAPQQDDVHQEDDFSDGNNGVVKRSSLEHTMELYDLISPAWIEKEALNLLICIREASTQKGAKRSFPVLLAGYGFGGVIMKHAMVIANSTPSFYDVAIRVNSLVFVYTPGPLRQRTKWENDLIEMLNITQKDYHGRLSQIFQSLVDFVFQLTYVFHRFTGKYQITHWVKSTSEGELYTNNYPHYLEKVVSLSSDGTNDILRCAIENLAQLELLRDSFAPHNLLLDQSNDFFGTDTISHMYFNALHSFSPSKWIIYSPGTIDEYSDFNDLRDVYNPLCKEIFLDKLHGGSIQVIGPKGHGKSTFMKFVCEKILQESTVLVIENFLSVSKEGVTLYDVFAAIIHQIISQRPSLFLAAQNAMADILGQEQWTDKALECLLSSILHHSQKTHFLMVIYDFEDWPSDVQAWWPKFSDLLADSLGSTCTFLISSYNSIQNFTHNKLLFSIKEQSLLTERFITARVKQFFDRGHSLISDRDVLRKDIERQCLLSAKAFEGSFCIKSSYLSSVFQRLTFHSLAAINESIENVGATEFDICRDHLLVLGSKPRIIVSWATSILSWILKSVRPLHLEELAAAAAIGEGRSTVLELREAISMDMERDLHNHLGGFVVVERKCARIISPQIVQDLLSNASDEQSTQQFHLQTSQSLVRLALKYITIVIERESGNSLNNSVSQISRSNREQTELEPDPILGFVDYACRFWVTHFHRIEASDERLKDEVISFLKNSKVANRWFELYLLCHGLKPCASKKNAISTVPLAEIKGLESTSTPVTFSAFQLASHFGLLSLLPDLILDAQVVENLEIIHVRRGYSEHDMAVVKTGLADALSSASQSLCCEQDEVTGKNNMPIHSVYKRYSLHQVARLGDFKAFQTKFQCSADLAQVDQDGRSALHMAAICGSLDIMTFIINTIHEQRADVLNARDQYNETPLIIATKMGNFEASKLLVELGADVSIRDATGKTAVHHAVLHCPQLLKYILAAHKASFFLPDDNKRTGLHTAAHFGSVESVYAVLGAFASEPQTLSDALNECDASGFTPLHYAAKNGNEEIARLFVEARQGAALPNDPQPAETLAARHGHLKTLCIIKQDELHLGNQLLIEAVDAGQLLIVHYLLEKDISADQEINNRIPICVAAAHGWDEIVKDLLRFGASINSLDSNRQTPLHHASKNGLYDVVKTLLSSEFRDRANVDNVDSLRQTPLHLAAKSGHERVIQLLLTHKADIEAETRQCQTPLHLAVEHPKAVQTLLDLGAFLNALDILGQTPLQKAIADKHYDSAKILLKKGAIIDVTDRDGESPLQTALANDDVPMVELIIDSLNLDLDSDDADDDSSVASYCLLAVKLSAKQVIRWLLGRFPNMLDWRDEEERTLLHEALEFDSPQIVDILIDEGFDVNQVSYGGTPLHVVVDIGQLENMKILIQKGGSTLLIDKANDEGNTPLHIAAEKDRAEAISFLLSAKADINKPGERNVTPLFMAAYAGSVTAVQELLTHEADPNISRDDGWAPLHAAADNAEITQLLVKSNANVNQQKSDLWTPLHLAAFWTATEVVEVLLQNGADPNIKDSDGKTPLDFAHNENIKKCFTKYQEKINYSNL